MPKRASRAPEQIAELEERRSARAAFSVDEGPAPKPRRAAKKATAKVKAEAPELPALPQQPATVYTSFSIRQSHREALREHAFARLSAGHNTRNDVSAVLRDVLDFWQAHTKEVNAWIATTYNAQGKR